MARWICPECGGGMPHVIREDGVYRCQWCGHGLTGRASERIAEADLRVVSDD